MKTEQHASQLNFLADQFQEHRARLLNLARQKLNPVLSRRLSVEDLIQDAFSAACRRGEYFENNPEVPVYFKLRTILLQTITDCERKHLQCKKRDAYKEMDVAEEGDAGQTAAQLSWNMFADSVTSPLSKIARSDRYDLLRNAIEALPENDRIILTLRHFDAMSNTECAQALGIEAKAASIRYVRALQRLQSKLLEFTEFRP